MNGPRLLGLDVGMRRIGAAIGDDLGIIATPIGFVERGPKDRVQFRAMIERYSVGGLIAGIPRGLSGAEGIQARDVRGYTNQLAKELGLTVIYYDERLTTVIAERQLISGGRSRSQRRLEIDAAAAAVMLQGYLDSVSTRR
jgi:putative holliday junction resolvase